METGELAVYRGCQPVVDARYDTGDTHRPSTVIINAVSEAAEIDPMDLPPLHKVVDLDAVDALFARNGGHDTPEALLSFQIETWNVFVRADGRIRVCDATQPTEPTPVFESSPA